MANKAQAIESLVAECNGRRRERTLSLGAVRQVVRDAIETGMAYNTGGFVPNSYKYPASTTVAGAVREGQWVAVTVETMGAQRSRGRGPAHLDRVAVVQRSRKALRPVVLEPFTTWTSIVLPVRQAKRWLSTDAT